MKGIQSNLLPERISPSQPLQVLSLRSRTNMHFTCTFALNSIHPLFYLNTHTNGSFCVWLIVFYIIIFFLPEIYILETKIPHLL